jgi:hypothetical protein
MIKEEYTGGSTSYYKINIDRPLNKEPYVAECNDIIEALEMDFAEGNVFKAVWRLCAARKGLKKRGYNSEIYDWEKIKFFAERKLSLLEEVEEDEYKLPTEGDCIEVLQDYAECRLSGEITFALSKGDRFKVTYQNAGNGIETPFGFKYLGELRFCNFKIVTSLTDGESCFAG